MREPIGSQGVSVMILLISVMVLVLGFGVVMWARRAFCRGGISPVMRYVRAWEDLLEVQAEWRPAVKCGSLPKGFARLDVRTGGSLRHGGVGASETVVVTVKDGDEAVFDFLQGGLIAVTFRGESYDDVTSAYKAAHRSADDLLRATRSQVGFAGVDGDDVRPAGGVDTSREAVLERRALVAKKRARLSGQKTEDDEDEAPKQRRRN